MFYSVFIRFYRLSSLFQEQKGSYSSSFFQGAETKMDFSMPLAEMGFCLPLVYYTVDIKNYKIFCFFGFCLRIKTTIYIFCGKSKDANTEKKPFPK